MVHFVCKVSNGEVVNQLGPSLPFLFCSASGVIYGALTFPGLREVIVILRRDLNQPLLFKYAGVRTVEVV